MHFCNASKSPVNQVTSKAMLTQMISIILRRMESDLVPDIYSSIFYCDLFVDVEAP